MKINSEKWPFKIIIEDKIGKTSGKQYQAISIGHTTKAKDWSETDHKYDTTWFNFFNEGDLLTLASLATAAYQELASARQQERESRRQPAQQEGGADPFEF